MIPNWKQIEVKPLKIEGFKKNGITNICFNKYL